MRVLVILLALVSIPAHATLVQIDINMDISENSPWLFDGPVPTTANGSFLLDTSSFNAQIRFGPIPTSPEVFLQEIFVNNVPVSDIRFSAGGVDLWTSDSGSSDFFAQWVEFRNFEGALYLNDQGRSFRAVDARFSGLAPYTLGDFLASPDPLVDVLAGLVPIGSSLNGEWGSLQANRAVAVVHAIPEPGTLALMCSGLAALALVVRRRMHHRIVHLANS